MRWITEGETKLDFVDARLFLFFSSPLPSSEVLYCFMQIIEWRDVGISNLAGVISLLAGLFMWVTSLPGVRKWNFELFFYTHQLYVVFVLFFAFHVGDFIFSMAAGAIFLFMLDRFLRFCQSRRTVDVVSAKCLPCGTVELVFSKPGSNDNSSPGFCFCPYLLLPYSLHFLLIMQICDIMPLVSFFFKSGSYHGFNGILSAFHLVLWMVNIIYPFS